MFTFPLLLTALILRPLHTFAVKQISVKCNVLLSKHLFKCVTGNDSYFWPTYGAGRINIIIGRGFKIFNLVGSTDKTLQFLAQHFFLI